MNFNDVIEKTRRRLVSGVREQVVTLTEDVAAGAESLNVQGTYLGAVQPGCILSVDLEQFYVQAVTSSGAVTVIPGYEGSMEAAHMSGTPVVVNARFPRFDIAQAINDDLLSLSANRLGAIDTVDVTYNPTYQGYDLTSKFDAVSSKILEVSFKIAPPVRSYPLIRRGKYAVRRSQSDTSVFPSGNGLILYEGAYPGLPVHVTFLAPFSPLVNLTDDLTAVAGLSATMYDLPDLGAAIRLMDPREVKRNFTEAQSDPRKAPEVPPQAVANSSVKLEKQRATRIDEEAERIRQAYPEAENF